MKDVTLMRRSFLLRHPDGRNVDVEARLHRIGGNAQAHFGITCQNGAAHERIAEAATDEVDADLKALIKVHLRGEDGVPMHAVANAAYHMGYPDLSGEFRL